MKAIGPTTDANLRMVAQEYRETATITGDTMTLAYTPLTTIDGVGLELVFVNGAVLTPDTDYTIDGRVITFTSALTADAVLVSYSYRV